MKTAIFLTVRAGSTRLPKKALLEVNGETVTDILIKRLKKTGLPVIMTTPDTEEDLKCLKPIAIKHNIGYFSGDKTNIIKRHYDCAVANDVDYVINVDGDDILTCSEVIERVDIYINYFNAPVTMTSGYPLGLNIIAYSRETLEDMVSEYNNYTDTNWGSWFKLHPHIVIPRLQMPYRLTLDIKEDFEVIKDVLTNCKDNETVNGIVDYLDNYPKIANLNMFYNDEYYKRLEELK